MTIDLDVLRRSFGGIAALYDEVRPDYPPQIVEVVEQRVAHTAPLRILEIGCGTGQATRMFAERGHTVHATDLSAELIAVARERLQALPDVSFSAGPFEQLDLPPASYDAVISAQAFHWIDPAVGLPKAHEALAMGGVLGLFWNFMRYDATPTLQRIRDICVHYAPAFEGWPDASDARFDAFAASWQEIIRAGGCFVAVELSIVERTLDFSHERFVKLLATFSWVQTLAEEARTVFLYDVAEALSNMAEPLELPTRTLVIAAQASGESA